MRTTKVILALIMLIAIVGGTSGVAVAAESQCGDVNGVGNLLKSHTGELPGEVIGEFAREAGSPGQLGGIMELCNPRK